MKILSINAANLHLGYLGCYGNEWIATPNIDRLAAESVVFDQHFAENPISMVSVISPGDWLEKCLGALTSLDGLVEIPPVSFAPPWSLPPDMAIVYTEDDEVEPWLDPTVGPCDDDELILRAQDTYAALVTWFDAQLGELLDRIDAVPWGNELMVVFHSASGYPLGEHGHIGWSVPSVYEEAAHVPFLIRFPGGKYAGTRIGALTQPADCDTTLKAWTSGADLEAGLDGLIRGTVDSIRPHAVSSCEIAGQSAIAVRTLDWALFRSGEKRELYLKPEDRWEVSDLAERETDAADELDAILKPTAAAGEPGA